MSKPLSRDELEALAVNGPSGPQSVPDSVEGSPAAGPVGLGMGSGPPPNARHAQTSRDLEATAGRYTIAGLFQSGTFGPDEETAIEEIRAIRTAFSQMTSPSRGWMTPRYGSGPPSTPRILANGPAWRRYVAWRDRWNRPAVPRSPSYPWGLSAADMACMALLEPWGITDLARLTGKSDLLTVELIIKAVRDYGSELKRTREKIWQAWDGIPADDRRRRDRNKRLKAAERAKRFRDKKVTPKTLQSREPV